MSLYYDAAPLLLSSQTPSGSLKSRVFGSKSLKNSPKQVYALVAEASKWSPILSEVIDKSQLLQHERKLSPGLALLLVHDLLLSKSGVSAPASHPLRVAVTKHKARLSAELTKIRVGKGFGSLEELRLHLARNVEPQIGDELSKVTASSETRRHWPHPRWVRINTLKTTLADQLATTLADYTNVNSLSEVLLANPAPKILFVDEHIPDLIALPAGTDLTRTAAYRNGLIILQDKASCFPAYLLDPKPQDGDCLDACAAPGNKTTHLAALFQGRSQPPRKARVWACERDKARSDVLTRMVSLAGCEDLVTVKVGQDFLLLDPEKAPWRDVGSLLLDPSCSGSGIVGRHEMFAVTLPGAKGNLGVPMKDRKRKRDGKGDTKPITNKEPEEEQEHQELSNGIDENMQLATRLKALSAFQLRLLLHAFRFPSAKRISYSTCSIYAEENELIAIAALQSPVAKLHNWRLLKRDEQVAGMRSWSIRGNVSASREEIGEIPLAADEIAESCIRCGTGTPEGTQGFFIAAFIRDHLDHEKHVKEPLDGTISNEILDRQGVERTDDEWEGFSDSS
ncbi:MAG: hypothetical protein Q9188_007327 [Gyalolechia gomerana]